MKAGAGSGKKKTGFEPLETALVRSMVERIQEILPLPNIVNSILKTINDPYASLGRVADTILKDQALTAKVLKVINSAFYGMQSRVSTVSQAVSLLGLDKIKNLAMAISLAEGLYRYSGLPFGRGALWHHSQACGVATSMVAEAAGYPNPEEALIVGLLHDIAKALWTELFPERFLAAIKAVHLEGRDPLEVEVEYLTVPHATVGSWMLEKWQLPGIIQQSVALHHETQVAVEDPSLLIVSRALYLGNLMAKLLNLGEGGNYRLGPLPGEILRALDLPRGHLVEQLRALPQAFFDFVEELQLEGARNVRLETLTAWLQDREVFLLLSDTQEEPGPGSLFFQAFAAQTRVLGPNDQPVVDRDPEPLVFWEGENPGEILPSLRPEAFQDANPRFLLFCHRVCEPPPLTASRVHLLGPEWRLEDFIKALNPERRD